MVKMNLLLFSGVVTSKIIDRLFKKTDLYSLFFAKQVNIPEIKIKTGSSVFRIALKDTYFQSLFNDRYFIFNQEQDKKNFEKYSQADKPFWKVNWKDFDPKDYWEIARGWQWLPAYLGAPSDQEKQILIEKIFTWLKANPYPNGLAWAVNLDVAIRAMNLLLLYHLCHDERFTNSLWQHYLYIKKRIWLSRRSMQNNHYLGELTVLAILAKLFGQKEQYQYKQELEKEFQNQFYEDGVNVEQSMRYHAFSVQFALLAKLFLGLELPFLEKALEYVLMMRKPDGTWPSFGDDDMGCVFRLNSAPMTDDYEALLGFLALLDSDPKAKYALEEWPSEPQFFIKDAQSKWDQLEKTEPQLSKIYPKGGLWIKRTGWENNANWMMVKFGPHKWHAHADLFHMELSISGNPLLMDSGTYRYNNVPEERKYFRSTAAHNCLEFEGLEQSRQLTTFRWGKTAKVIDWDITKKEDKFTFTGSHNGYSNKGITHNREIEGQNDLSEIIIRDTLEGKTNGDAEIYWHFHPTIEITEKGKEYQLFSGSETIGIFRLDSNDSVKAEIVETSYSEHYGHLSKKKTLVIRACKKALQPLIVKSHFIFNSNEESS